MIAVLLVGIFGLTVSVSRSAARYFKVGGHDSVWVSSSRYDRATLSSIAGFIGSLPHGREIDKLLVYVADPEEVFSECDEAYGCYEVEDGEDWMIVPGEQPEEEESSIEEIIAHEYGHHLANTRPGGAYGTPRWDLFEHVCSSIQSGLLVPGAEGTRYWANPEEIFAESYAALTFPEIGLDQHWLEYQYPTAMQPTAESAAAIRLDLEKPWPKRYAERRLRSSCGSGEVFYPTRFR